MPVVRCRPRAALALQIVKGLRKEVKHCTEFWIVTRDQSMDDDAIEVGIRVHIVILFAA